MNYATTSQGRNKATQRTPTKTIAPADGRISGQDRAQKRCGRNTKRQAEAGSGSHAAHAFLRASFSPRLTITEAVQDCKNLAKLERDFYKSLSQLADRFDIQPKPAESDEFPYNIAFSLSDIKEQLKSKKADWSKIRLIHSGRATFFAKEQRYDTDRTLYYIPVIPLYQMLNKPKLKNAALLLVSVCAYLYKIADIPYYRQESSYMCDMYNMLRQMHDQEAETDPDILEEFEEAEKIGDIIENELLDCLHLTSFEDRLNQFKSSNAFDRQCQEVAKKAFDLYRQFPTMRLDNKFKAADLSEDDGDTYIVTLEKYISFYASGKGDLADLLIEWINNDLQEYGTIEEPVIYQLFDNRKLPNNDFSFEERLFNIIDELTTLLYDYERLNS